MNLRFRPVSSLSLALVVATLSAPAVAAESYDSCTAFIDSVPATISTQGVYCLRKDVATASSFGEAIIVGANNVTIDCNGFKIGGLGAGIGTGARGILLDNRSNTTVRNCAIRGFRYGVWGTSGVSGTVIEDNRFDGNTLKAILLFGDANIVRRNVVTDTGGSTSAASSAVVAIQVGDGDAIRVEGNLVAGVVPTAQGYSTGVLASGATGTSIRGNQISGVVGGPGGTAAGLLLFDATHAVLGGNDVYGDGASGSTGIQCDSSSGAMLRDSSIAGFDTGTTGCADAGGNFVAE